MLFSICPNPLPTQAQMKCHLPSRLRDKLPDSLVISAAEVSPVKIGIHATAVEQLLEFREVQKAVWFVCLGGAEFLRIDIVSGIGFHFLPRAVPFCLCTVLL